MKNERKRRISILLEEIQYKNIYLYGAGIRGKVAIENLNTLGLGQRVVGFIDDYVKAEQYCEKDVMTVDAIKGFDLSNAVFIITTYEVKKMVIKLMENLVSSENIYFLPELLINDIDISVFQLNRDKIVEVYNSLNDNLSKYIYKSLFEVYICGNIGILSRTKGDIQYFPVKGTTDQIDGFCITDTESFIDCGAYDGDTIRKFKEETKNKYKKIWAIEPDADNFLKLSDYIKREKDTRVELIHGGVHNSDSTMYFSGNKGTTSALVATGEKSIKVYQLDSLVKEAVTFIKMDIEGSEKDALMGAKGIISKYKPKLAICIYHKTEDLWELPLLIKSLNPEYHIYLRNYEDRIDETVCYAV